MLDHLATGAAVALVAGVTLLGTLTIYLARALVDIAKEQATMIGANALRMSYLKGLNPAAENPGKFGPQAMAEAHRTAYPEQQELANEEAAARRQEAEWDGQVEREREQEERQRARMAERQIEALRRAADKEREQAS